MGRISICFWDWVIFSYSSLLINSYCIILWTLWFWKSRFCLIPSNSVRFWFVGSYLVDLTLDSVLPGWVSRACIRVNQVSFAKCEHSFWRSHSALTTWGFSPHSPMSLIALQPVLSSLWQKDYMVPCLVLVLQCGISLRLLLT